MADTDTPHAILTRLADTLSGVLAPDFTKDVFRAEEIKQSATARVMLLKLGDIRAVAKIFAGSEAGRAAFGRERRVLEGLPAGLAPRLRFVSEPDRVLVSDFVAGSALGAGLNGDNLMQRAEFLGQWFGRLAGAVPSEETETDWNAYLARYRHGFNPDILAQQAAALKRVPIARLTLAHNDNALSNFILGADKRLYGVDFEDARLKPEGWDLITAATALLRRLPEELQTIASALSRGYGMGAPEAALPDGFEAVIGRVALAQLAEGAAKAT